MEILSLQEFIDSEQIDIKSANELRSGYPSRNILWYGDTACCIFKLDKPVNEYVVQIGNTEKTFDDKYIAAKYLYKEWYLPECTDLFNYKKYLKIRGFEEHHTGGGCMALRQELPHDYEILITDSDADIPLETDTDIVIGLYDNEGDSVITVELKKEYMHEMISFMFQYVKNL